MLKEDYFPRLHNKCYCTEVSGDNMYQPLYGNRISGTECRPSTHNHSTHTSVSFWSHQDNTATNPTSLCKLLWKLGTYPQAMAHPDGAYAHAITQVQGIVTACSWNTASVRWGLTASLTHARKTLGVVSSVFLWDILRVTARGRCFPQP